jgi:PPK2 family polyphosphate:nucleotide phosphotransferase
MPRPTSSLPPPRPITAPPGSALDPRKIDTAPDPGGWTKSLANAQIERNTAVTEELAARLYAENRRSLLLVLQGLDTSGKDGTIRTVMRGVNPQSCQVSPFKVPTPDELDHDFLWRVHNVVPRRGNIGIFNRSHYEDVLVVRVKSLVTESVWRQRYEQINEFEKLLSESGTRLIKCFLHISKDEQRERLQERLDDPHDRWKFNPDDLKQRACWDEYMAAYADALARCNTDCAPWYVVPADRKWYRNLIVSQLVRETLAEMDPQYPAPDFDPQDIVIE